MSKNNDFKFLSSDLTDIDLRFELVQTISKLNMLKKENKKLKKENKSLKKELKILSNSNDNKHIKYIIGDRVRIIDNDTDATIVSISYSTSYQNTIYFLQDFNGSIYTKKYNEISPL